MGFYNPIYKNKLFFFQSSLSTPFAQDIYGLLFINMNILMSSDKKKWNKTEKDRKNMEKENNSNKSDFSENEIPDLNSLKPFKFKPKTNRY